MKLLNVYPNFFSAISLKIINIKFVFALFMLTRIFLRSGGRFKRHVTTAGQPV
jgi:hypothetical protein